MAEFDRPTIAAQRAGTAAAIDEGLRSYMLKVYNYMGVGLVVTGLVAYFGNAFATTSDPAQAVAQLTNGTMLTSWGALLYTSPLMWVIAFAPLAFVLVLSFGINKLSGATAQILFWVFAAVMGLSLSSIFMVYTDASIAKVFFISAATFGAMSLYGYTTKRDLTAMGSFLFMGLIGIIIASLVNLFLASSMLQFIVSVVGVLVFSGLTAWDTQRLKNDYIYGYASAGGDIAERAAITGALSLYLNFINLFTLLLQLLGQRE
jgi:uncharacterized protein